jgi:hypothetical protein
VAELQFGSKRQVGEQPSLGKVLPSSQASEPSTLPSPQTVGVQTLFCPELPVHLKPISSLQLAEQPSPLAVLPSSHISPAVITPSPQAGLHGLPGTRHCQPGSTVLQSLEQPSPLTVLPSSQVSSEVRMLFPHLARFSHFCPGVGQFQFASVWHMRLQPSPLSVFPSSQFSPSLISITPLPQALPVAGGPASGGAGRVLMIPGPEPPAPFEPPPPPAPFPPPPGGTAPLTVAGEQAGATSNATAPRKSKALLFVQQQMRLETLILGMGTHLIGGHRIGRLDQL